MSSIAMVADISSYIQQWRWIPGVTLGSSWVSPFAGSLVYLACIYLITLAMRERKAFLLQKINIVHNFFLCSLSFVMLVGVLHAAFYQAKEQGIMSLLCEATPHAVSGPIGFWIYVFHLSKYYEMLDTVILALRKKPIIFLHIFHHMIVVPVTWKWLDDQWLNGSWWCTFVNSLVHCFMYYYYLLTAMGRTVWWKQYITQGQIVQFFTGFFIVSFWFGIRSQPQYQCHGGLPAAVFSHSMNCLMIILFFRFYFKTYKRRENPGKEKHM